MKHFVLLLSILIVFSWRFITTKPPEYSSGIKLKITATLREEPAVTGNTQRFTFAGINITTWKYPEYHYGDRLVITGVVKNNGLEMPEIVQERVKGPYADAQGKQESERARGIMGGILELRNRMDEVFRKSLPEPQASLLSGITLGIKSNLSKDFYNNLQKTGTMHIIVASGMNVALVSGTIMNLFLWFCSRRKAIILSVLATWFYVLLAGGDLPVVRAGIMGTAVLLAQLLGKEPDMLRVLSLTAGIILFVNPTSLFDIGFQLSFGATLGIVLLSKKISNSLHSLPESLRNDFSQTIAAQIFTTPILLLAFGSYSWLSIPVNLLVAWPLVWILRFGLIIGIIGLVFAPVGMVISWLVLPLLTYFVKIVSFFGKL